MIARRAVAAGVTGALALALAALGDPSSVAAPRVTLECRIRQDTDLILFSDYGEPPQFAIWLEDPAGKQVRTLFVTRRSGKGVWEGKAECPAALPRWFRVYEKETGRKGLPTPKAPAPDAVSGATPKSEQFTWRAEVERGRRWVCWIEVNLAADFNQAFPRYNEATGEIDTHDSGQPPLLYRAELLAEPGSRLVPKLWAYVVPGSRGKGVERDLSRITTAKEIFRSIQLRVLEFSEFHDNSEAMRRAVPLAPEGSGPG